MSDYIKSPLNYIGNKYRIIDQLHSYFPQKIGVMFDLFCGGCDVTFNIAANKHVANDINYHLIGIFKAFQDSGLINTLQYIDETIRKWELSKDNKEGYLAFRKYYNETKVPLDLYVLMCFSFNYQFRFNANHEYNNTFGNSRSSFNNVMRENLKKIFSKIDKVNFTSYDYTEIDYSVLKRGDFLYADPPYLLTCGSYNDGKRGFRGWNINDEISLYKILDTLNKQKVKFALSNVIEHKGSENDILKNWIKQGKYHIHNINFNYDNCNYHTKNKEHLTREVLVTNY